MVRRLRLGEGAVIRSATCRERNREGFNTLASHNHLDTIRCPMQHRVAICFEYGTNSRQIDNYESLGSLCVGMGARPTRRLEFSAGRCDRVRRGSDLVRPDPPPVMRQLWDAGNRMTLDPVRQPRGYPKVWERG